MSETYETLEYIKIELREKQMPYFTDEDIRHYLAKHDGNMNDALYEMLIVKAEDSSIAVSGLTTQDTSGYFRRLASRYRPNNSGILGGVD